ncbi:MAG: endonuclease [Saprospiraceae bacterium]|nr:endonuclease [Saprospiraceae bacterium]
MRWKQILLALTWIFNLEYGAAQWHNQTLYPNDSGLILITKLVNDFKPSIVLDYSPARVKMYTEIYNEADTVRCVYTKHALYVNHLSQDAIADLYKNGNPNGITCEHTFPQSMGAETGNARSDMHHLYPSRAAVNEARWNYPYSEIDDTKTKHWFYKSTDLILKPGKEINEYSESIDGFFEPREDHKGNVARAIFYFFTMYELQSNKSFFEGMKKTLCDWHLQDPVDSLEWARTYAIAKYQENKANPFVLDCSLTRRTYCPQSAVCKTTESYFLDDISVQLFPNPSQDFFEVITDQSFDIMSLQISGMEGISKSLNFEKYENRYQVRLNDISPGLYLLRITSQDGKFILKKLIIR